VYDQTGKKGHQALRTLVGAGFENVLNVSGGFLSLAGYVRAVTPKSFLLELPDPQPKKIGEKIESEDNNNTKEEIKKDTNEPLYVDVRTPGEFQYGAYPDAVNIPLDEIEDKVEELGSKDREIILYCTSGARSAYAVNILREYGFTNLKNGGSITRMMARAR
jgi:rhodanese-related sulfurtransferase